MYTGDEHQALPVVNHSFWTRNGAAVFARGALLDLQFALCERLVGLVATRLGKCVDPEQVSSVLQFGVIAGVGSLDVGRECLHRFRLRGTWGARMRGQEATFEDGEEQA